MDADEFEALRAEVDLCTNKKLCREMYERFHNKRAFCSYDLDHGQWYRWHLLANYCLIKLHKMGWKVPKL